ncbi:glycoside hydrolase family 53 protein [Fodinibius sp.]|uniref:glycoside hydrolase family 53 protein n=1 Tax=Fodinibius sp. TaxID=1872440 RepID=UPI002ACE0A7F|nr:glycosyl hydrolase 53 family protein [Fodinibius sp.]MDZ7660115.1 glycosyl hydrolase 53 family protein [Fodinibius sp.]
MLRSYVLIGFLSLIVISCGSDSTINKGSGDDDNGSNKPPEETTGDFVMGADLSYVNQILDHGGTYRDSSEVENPYKLFSEYGTDVARFRLWHDPEWTATVYEGENNPMYNDLADVTEAISRAKEHGMAINLDIHYSDTWADPSQQKIPEAWRNITSLDALKDAVYNYTRETLEHLDEQGLMPEYVQIGNETNCGLMYSNAPQNFPRLNVCDGNNWANAGELINSGIEAVRDVASNSDVDTKIILHIAQPENVSWWFDNMTTTGNVTDFDIIGFSYYTPWSKVPLEQISDHVSDFSDAFDKEVMVVEAAYPWTMDYADDYNNKFGQDALVSGYPATKEGQRDFMIDLTKEIMDGGGTGLMYWEPAWITSNMKTQWGTGSAWENNTFFDFEGNVHSGIEYMQHEYERN